MGLTANPYALHRNLVNANHVFFVSPIHTPQQAKYDALMKQSAGRALRLMQTRKVYIYMCVVLHTVDVDVLEMRTSSRLVHSLVRNRKVIGQENAIAAQPHHRDELEDVEMQDAHGPTIMPQGTKRKRHVAEIDDADNASAKRTKNAGLPRRPTKQTDVVMIDDDDDAALARQLQADHDTQATDAAIAEQIQIEEYQAAADKALGDGHAEGNTTEYHDYSAGWQLVHTSLLTKEELSKGYGSGFEKAPDEHEFE